MASHLTRSSRRSEGLTTRSSTRNNVAINPGSHDKPHQPNIGRKKRPRDPADSEDPSLMVKKARISIEITSRPKAQPKPRSLVINAQADDAPQRSASPPIQAKPTAVQIEPPPPPRSPQITTRRLSMASNMSWTGYSLILQISRLRNANYGHRRVRGSRASCRHTSRSMTR
jgi:hypothetical protein